MIFVLKFLKLIGKNSNFTTNNRMKQVYDLFLRLKRCVDDELGDLLYSVGAISGSFKLVCDDLKIILTTLLEQPQSFDITEDLCLHFLSSTLPTLIEVILKRHSHRLTLTNFTNSLFHLVITRMTSWEHWSWSSDFSHSLLRKMYSNYVS
jgi:hypothetical protein